MMLKSLSRPLPAIIVQRRSLTSVCTLKQPGKSAKIGLICASAFSLCATAAGMLTICEADRLERWQDRWAIGRTNWHRSKPNRSLVKHYERFLGTSDKREMTEKRRILVPLCGKTIDMPYMAEKGHEVLGVEGIEAAAWQLQRDSWLKFDVSQVKPSYASAGGDAEAPAFIPAHTFDKRRPGYVFKTDTEGTGYYLDTKPIKWFRDTRKGISLVVYDFFRLTPTDIGTFDRIWDRGSLVAINPSDREAYVTTCDSLLQPEGQILLVTIVYDQEKMKGPPYSLSPADVHRLYGKLGYKVETIDSFDARNDYQGSKWQLLHKTGLEERAFLLTKPSSSSSKGTPGWFARVFLGRKPRQH